MHSFSVLLALEGRSRGTDTTIAVLDLQQIRQAVIHGRSEMLILMLKQMWKEPSMLAATDTDMVAMMNEARAGEYPDFEKTTRILAMEVAAKWKMDEIEQTGRKAHRVPKDWPPRLTYPVDGCTESQVWFIPRNCDYDVDWEPSVNLSLLHPFYM